MVVLTIERGVEVDDLRRFRFLRVLVAFSPLEWFSHRFPADEAITELFHSLLESWRGCKEGLVDLLSQQSFRFHLVCEVVEHKKDLEKEGLPAGYPLCRT